MSDTLPDKRNSAIQKEREEFFTYYNPINGRYCAFPNIQPTIAVFRHESNARREEAHSSLLKNMVGRWISKSEIEEIANRRTQGRWAVVD